MRWAPISQQRRERPPERPEGRSEAELTAQRNAEAEGERRGRKRTKGGTQDSGASGGKVQTEQRKRQNSPAAQSFTKFHFIAKLGEGGG